MQRFTQSLPYLLNRVGVRMGELFGNEIAADGLTAAGYRVLAALNEVDNQRLTDLSAMTTVEMTTLSRLVAAMEGRRLVRRRRPKDNLRTVQISLLAGGRALVAKYGPLAALDDGAAAVRQPPPAAGGCAKAVPAARQARRRPRRFRRDTNPGASPRPGRSSATTG